MNDDPSEKNPEKEHPELKEINNICDISSGNSKTDDICDVVNKDKKNQARQKAMDDKKK